MTPPPMAKALRLRAAVACFDRDGDGGLGAGELHELVREMCVGDTHADHVASELGLEARSH